MGATETDPLWPRVAERVRSARGWSLRPVAQLGRARAARRTWLAEAAGADGSRAVVVKASANPFAASRAAWVAGALSLLGERGAPAPATGRGLREFLEPAWGHHLPSGDLVHGDLNLRLGLAAQRNQPDALATWRHTTDALLDTLR